MLTRSFDQDGRGRQAWAMPHCGRWRWVWRPAAVLGAMAAAMLLAIWLYPWAQDLYYLRKRYEGRAAVVRLLKNSSFPPSAVLWARGFTARDWTGWGGCAGYEFKLADGWLGDFTREFGLSKETLCDMPVDGTMTNWWNVAAGRMPQNVELYAAVGMKLWVFPDSHECFLYWSGSP